MAGRWRVGMERLVVVGGYPLRGTVRVSGAKNAALAILCASMLSPGRVVIENVPRIKDIEVMLELLGGLGAQVQTYADGRVCVVPPQHVHGEASYSLVKQLRASNLLLGPLLGRYRRVRLALPGGCNIGARPMDLHFKGLQALGATLDVRRGYIEGWAGTLRGTRIYLDLPSVGATENIMMAAVLARGQTVIENAAREPEVVDLANFLNAMGARVRGAGTDVIKVDGVENLAPGVHHAVIPDRIEAGTYMVAGVATRGEVTVTGVIPRHLEAVTAKLREAGAEVVEAEDSVTVRGTGPLGPIDVRTMPYPGFPTDMQSQIMALLATVPGTSLIVENIFENRFQVAYELQRMGARIRVEGRVAVVEGVERLQGTSVRATDLRAGAALVVAGLAAEGRTEIHNAHYLARGYEDAVAKFQALGGRIWVDA